jgi:cytochrome d ubiquinol oxidase subunit II
MYLANTIDDSGIIGRIRGLVIRNALPFLVFFLFFLVNILLRKGFAYNPDNGIVFMEPYKYFNNLLAMPYVLVSLLVGVVLVLFSLYRTWTSYDRCHSRVIWLAGPGTILVVFSLFLTAGFNNTAFYPSTYDLQSSLTIENASSSHYTLTAMSYVSLFVPFVFAYIWYAWRAINNKKIDKNEMKAEEHKY